MLNFFYFLYINKLLLTNTFYFLKFYKIKKRKLPPPSNITFLVIPKYITFSHYANKSYIFVIYISLS